MEEYKNEKLIKQQEVMIESQSKLLDLYTVRLKQTVNALNLYTNSLDAEKAAHAKTKKKLVSYKKGRLWTYIVPFVSQVSKDLDDDFEKELKEEE